MSVGWRFANRESGHTRLTLFFSLAAFVAMSRWVDASCGDHLSRADNSPTGQVDGNERLTTDLADSQRILLKPRSELPCRGPQCRRGPVVPLQEHTPVVPAGFRPEFVFSEATWLPMKTSPVTFDAGPNIVAVPGVPRHVERPPE